MEPFVSEKSFEVGVSRALFRKTEGVVSRLYKNKNLNRMTGENWVTLVASVTHTHTSGCSRPQRV